MAEITLVVLYSVCTSIAGSFSSGDSPAKPAVLPVPDPDNGGLKLTTGFGALTVADGLGTARHIAVDETGTVFVKLNKLKDGKGIVELQGTNGDGMSRLAKTENRRVSTKCLRRTLRASMSRANQVRMSMPESSIWPAPVMPNTVRWVWLRDQTDRCTSRIRLRAPSGG